MGAEMTSCLDQRQEEAPLLGDSQSRQPYLMDSAKALFGDIYYRIRWGKGTKGEQNIILHRQKHTQ